MLRFILLCLSIVCLPLAANAQTLILGVVPQQSPLVLFKKWTPVANYLSEKTGLDIKFRTEKSIPQFEQALYRGDYDIGYMNPYHYVVAHKEQGYQAALRRTKDIRGILVSQKGQTLSQINPQSTFLFPSPNAFAATLIMKYELMKNFALNLKKTQNFKYVNSHDSVYKGIARNLGDFGGGVQRTFNNFSATKDKEKLQILYTTQPYPSHPIAYKPTLSPAIQQAITEAFLQMPTAILQSLSIKQVKKTTDQEYDIIRKISDVLITE